MGTGIEKSKAHFYNTMESLNTSFKSKTWQKHINFSIVLEVSKIIKCVTSHMWKAKNKPSITKYIMKKFSYQ